MAIPYSKQTWTDGSGGGTPVSAARLGVLEQGVSDAQQMPAARVYHSTTQSLTSGATTALNFNSERFDQAGGASAAQHDTATNNSRLTALYAGVYAISGTAGFAANATGIRVVSIRVNGTTEIARVDGVASASINSVMSVATFYSLAVNDYVELTAFQNSGGALNTLQSANYTPEFMMVRVA